MIKNSLVLDPNTLPLGMTYPRRAKQLVKKGRARWVNENTIIMESPVPYQEMEATINMDGNTNNFTTIEVPEETTPWTEYFKKITEEIMLDKDLVTLAVNSINNASTMGYEQDTPSQSICKIIEAHYQCKAEVLKSLMEFVDKRGLR